MMPLTNGSVISLSIPLRPAPLRRVPEEDGAAAGDDEVTEDFAVFFDVPLLTGPGKAATNGSNINDARSVVVPALPNTDLNLYLLGGYDTTKPLPFHISYDASRLVYDGPAPWYTLRLSAVCSLDQTAACGPRWRTAFAVRTTMSPHWVPHSHNLSPLPTPSL